MYHHIAMLVAILGLSYIMGMAFWEVTYCADHQILCITPSHIYENTKLNYPTCVILCVLLRVTNVIFLLYLLVILCCAFFYWLVTVGRDDDEEE